MHSKDDVRIVYPRSASFQIQNGGVSVSLIWASQIRLQYNLNLAYRSCQIMANQIGPDDHNASDWHPCICKLALHCDFTVFQKSNQYETST